jgi:hypothetical protein
MAEKYAESKTVTYGDYSVKIQVYWDPEKPMKEAYSKFCLEYWKTSDYSTKANTPFYSIMASTSSPWYKTDPATLPQGAVTYKISSGGSFGAPEVHAEITISPDDTANNKYTWNLTLKAGRAEIVPTVGVAPTYKIVDYSNEEGVGTCTVLKVPH